MADRKLKFLFAHNGYLGQFEYFAPWLQNLGHEITVLHRDAANTSDSIVTKQFKDAALGDRSGIPIMKEAENALVTATGIASTAIRMREEGFYPDVMIAHCGWGTGLMLKHVWPDAIYIAYHEWFYRRIAGYPDTPLEPATNATLLELAHNLGRNFPIISEFLHADSCWSPNAFQASQFPPFLREKIKIMHDGVDIDFFKPNPDTSLELKGLKLPPSANIVTYIGRGFEPIRRFPDAMQAIKEVQLQQPDTHFIIVGENRVAYGDQLEEGESWLHRLIDELDLDLSRLHFVGRLDKPSYLKVLQASSAHIYLSEPFVLSWSFFEALATGCTVVTNDVRSITDIVRDRDNALISKTGDIAGLAENIMTALSDRTLSRRIGRNARKLIVENYSLEKQSQKRLAEIRELLRKNGSGNIIKDTG